MVSYGVPMLSAGKVVQTQLPDHLTVTALAEAARDVVAAMLVAGTNVTLLYNDAGDTLTISAAGTGGGITDPEVVRDTIAAALIPGDGVSIFVDDAANTITLSASTAAAGILDDLQDVVIDRTITVGNVVTPGVTDGQVLSYVDAENAWRNTDVPPHVHPEYAPSDYVPPYMLRGVVVNIGDAVPTDIPDDVLIVDENNPPSLLNESVNTVSASGTAVTLPGPSTATMHDITLTGNATLTFPTPTAGQSFSVLLRQDATGSRTVTWPATIRWPAPGTAPALSTAASSADLFSFVSIGGGVWRSSAPDRYVS